ncbi:hypothetical protein N9B47_02715, partial [bacterium]|nr:hypothetical protein [bacterium]
MSGYRLFGLFRKINTEDKVNSTNDENKDASKAEEVGAQKADHPTGDELPNAFNGLQEEPAGVKAAVT